MFPDFFFNYLLLSVDLHLFVCLFVLLYSRTSPYLVPRDAAFYSDIMSLMIENKQIEG